MDWNFAIERNRDALKRVLAALVAMAGLVGSDAKFPSSLWGRGATAAGRPRAMEMALGAPSARSHAEGQDGAGRPTLPRHLHRAVLRLLRPAEAAARRLVIMAARGVVVTLPPARARKPKPAPPIQRPGTVTGIWMPPHLSREADRTSRARRRAPVFRPLPLFDPLPRTGFARRRPSGTPRLCLPGFSAPHPVPPERPSKGFPHLGPDDAIDAARLALRLGAVGRALDDLPAHARRFARWRMRAARDAAGAQDQNHDAAGAQNQNRGTTGASETQNPGRRERVWPLRPGLLSASRRAGHEVHEILRDAHSLAAQALEHPDSS